MGLNYTWYDDPFEFLEETIITLEYADELIVADKRGNTTGYGYDARGNVILVTDALANTVQITYDAQNNPLSITNQRDHTTGFIYDTNGNLETITDALSGVTTFVYDAFGQVTSIGDQDHAYLRRGRPGHRIARRRKLPDDLQL